MIFFLAVNACTKESSGRVIFFCGNACDGLVPLSDLSPTLMSLTLALCSSQLSCRVTSKPGHMPLYRPILVSYLKPQTHHWHLVRIRLDIFRLFIISCNPKDRQICGTSNSTSSSLNEKGQVRPFPVPTTSPLGDSITDLPMGCAQPSQVMSSDLFFFTWPSFQSLFET